MLVLYLLFSLLYVNCKSENMLFNEKQLQEQSLIKCITDIVEKYFSEDKSLTYVDMKTDADKILKAIHSSTTTAVVYRQETKQSYFRHQGYLIVVKTATILIERFKFLLQEPTWNPYARFLIIINSFKEEELKKIFDELLQRYVINVIVVNGSKDAEIYAYNPYANYGCGKYYDEIISYGSCSMTKENLFPNKLITGLRNCNIVATVGDRAPYGIQPSNSSDTKPGTEQYIFEIIAEIEQFNVNFTFDYDKRAFTTITKHMQVIGPMEKLQNNETDVMFGSSVLVSSRADAFTYLHGHLDYDDELRFLVKRASYKAIWKSAYLEFHPFVWCLLIIVFLLNSTIIIILSRAKDKTEITLKMLNSLLLHGFKMPERMTVKFFFIIWVWFAYLINSIYQASLVSLTANPIMERQVLTEIDLVRHNLKPCISPALSGYIYSESNISSPMNSECLDNLENVKIVARSENLFTLIQQSLFKYYKKSFNDEFGSSPVYSFKIPYAKLVFGYFFRKGFPVSDRMRKNAVRLRENGLIDKSLKDHYYARKITHHYHKKEFETRTVIPWWMYAIGCSAATVVFISELLYARYKNSFLVSRLA